VFACAKTIVWLLIDYKASDIFFLLELLLAGLLFEGGNDSLLPALFVKPGQEGGLFSALLEGSVDSNFEGGFNFVILFKVVSWERGFPKHISTCVFFYVHLNYQFIKVYYILFSL
jgi:hypothetical protein